MSPFTIEADADEIPVGHHDVTIVEAREIESKKGTPGIGLTLRDDQGRELEDAVWVTPSSYWKAEELVAACGLEWPYGGGEIDERDLVDKRVHIEVEEQEYEGRTSLRVREWTTASEPEIPADTEGLGGHQSDAGGGGFAEAAGDEEVPSE